VAIWLREVFDLELEGLLRISGALAGLKLVIAAGFLAYLIEFARAVTVGREPDPCHQSWRARSRRNRSGDLVGPNASACGSSRPAPEVSHMMPGPGKCTRIGRHCDRKSNSFFLRMCLSGDSKYN